MSEHTPTPWELIEATEHHGAYVVNGWGRTVCDLYAMSNPMAASVRNGGTSFPVSFDDMAANAAFIVKAVNGYDAMKRRIAVLEMVIDEELVPSACRDDANAMIVRSVNETARRARNDRNAAEVPSTVS